jgi:hypothetical protein
MLVPSTVWFQLRKYMKKLKKKKKKLTKMMKHSQKRRLHFGPQSWRSNADG